MTPDAVTLGLAGLIGLVVGSFLNVCIHRVPRGESINVPASHCPHCGHPLRWYDNVPILGYLLLRGRCRHCHDLISAMYPIVEAITGSWFVLTFLTFGWSVLFVARVVFGCAIIVLSVIDLRERLLPNVITLPGIVAGLLFALVAPPGITSALIGAVGAAVALELVAQAVSFFMKKEAMGFGDVKMVAMIGAFLGWQATLITVFAASFIGILAAAIGAMLRASDRHYEWPFGTYLGAASLVAALAGDRLFYGYIAASDAIMRGLMGVQ